MLAYRLMVTNYGNIVILAFMPKCIIAPPGGKSAKTQDLTTAGRREFLVEVSITGGVTIVVQAGKCHLPRVLGSDPAPQIFFAYRLYRITTGLPGNAHNWFLPAAIVSFSFAQLGWFITHMHYVALELEADPLAGGQG